MGVKIFCGHENRRFPSEEFFDDDQGVVVHVVHDDKGHTVEGWKATFRVEGTRYSDYTVHDLVIEQVEIPEYDAFDFGDEA